MCVDSASRSGVDAVRAALFAQAEVLPEPTIAIVVSVFAREMEDDAWSADCAGLLKEQSPGKRGFSAVLAVALSVSVGASSRTLSLAEFEGGACGVPVGGCVGSNDVSRRTELACIDKCMCVCVCICLSTDIKKKRGVLSAQTHNHFRMGRG